MGWQVGLNLGSPEGEAGPPFCYSPQLGDFVLSNASYTPCNPPELNPPTAVKVGC